MTGLRSFALLFTAWLIAWSALAADQQSAAAQTMDDLTYGRGPIGGPFPLVDQTGRLRSDHEFRGKLMVIYFGYTYCPGRLPCGTAGHYAGA